MKLPSSSLILISFIYLLIRKFIYLFYDYVYVRGHVYDRGHVYVRGHVYDRGHVYVRHIVYDRGHVYVRGHVYDRDHENVNPQQHENARGNTPLLLDDDDLPKK